MLIIWLSGIKEVNLTQLKNMELVIYGYYFDENGNGYAYRLELTGRLPNAVADSTFMILSNDADITFEAVSVHLLSSNTNDHLEDIYFLSMESLQP